jgi:hypothetical protein
MGPGLVSLVVTIAVVFIIGLFALLGHRRRSQRLQQSFGPEYDRVVLEQQGDFRRAEAILADREKRVQGFRLSALSPAQRTTYAMEWMTVERRFMDDPATAVRWAEGLIKRAMTDRGYPEADYEQRSADLSVSYPAVVQHYRAAQEIVARHSDGHTPSEDLRQAIGYYRSLFDELLEPSKEELAKDALLDPVWDEMYNPVAGEPVSDELLEPMGSEPVSEELPEPAKIDRIDGRRRRVNRGRAS